MAKECDLRGKLGKALFSVFEAFNFDLIIHRLLRPVELFCPKCPECAQLLESCLTLPPYRASMGFSRQAYWNGLSYPPPADPPDSGMEPVPPATNALGQILYPLSHQSSPHVQYSVSFKLVQIWTNGILDTNTKPLLIPSEILHEPPVK